MKGRAQVGLLPDGRRLHLHDGPIDLIVEAFGIPEQITACYNAAAERFATILDELCAEISLLRKPARRDGPLPAGVVARRMMAAVAPYCERTFITPMAAVAGAVAEEILGAMTAAANLSRAYVNNGGDIALHLSSGEHFIAGMSSARIVRRSSAQPRSTRRSRREVLRPVAGAATASRSASPTR